MSAAASKNASPEATRTCAGCNGIDAPESMERFVWSAQTGLLHDLRGKAPGRGVHVHPNPQCMQKAVRFGFARSVRETVQTESAAVIWEQVLNAIGTRVDETIRLAIRSGAGAVGAHAVDEHLRTGEATLLLIATDAGGATRSKYTRNAKGAAATVASPFDGERMGAYAGRQFVAVMSIGGKLAMRAQRDIGILDEFARFGVATEVEAGSED